MFDPDPSWRDEFAVFERLSDRLNTVEINRVWARKSWGGRLAYRIVTVHDKSLRRDDPQADWALWHHAKRIAQQLGLRVGYVEIAPDSIGRSGEHCVRVWYYP